MKRPYVYVIAPNAAEKSDANKAILKYCRELYKAGLMPISAQLAIWNYLRISDSQDYKNGRAMAQNLLRRAKDVVVCGDALTDSMRCDIELAQRLGKICADYDGVMRIFKLSCEGENVQ